MAIIEESEFSLRQYDIALVYLRTELGPELQIFFAKILDLKNSHSPVPAMADASPPCGVCWSSAIYFLDVQVRFLFWTVKFSDTFGAIAFPGSCHSQHSKSKAVTSCLLKQAA